MTTKRSRFFSAFLALALTAAFVGCGAATAGKPSTEADSSEKKPQISTPSPLEAPETSLRMLGPGTDHGRYRAITVPTDYTSLLCYLDFDTGNEVPLCASPNCEHQDKSCPAWLHEHNYTILNALDDEHLILMVSDLHAKQTTLSIANADGSDPRVLAEYPVTYAISPVFAEAFLADDEYLYYFVDVVPEIDDKTVSEPLDLELFRVSLKGGAPEKMRNIKRDDTCLIGTWGRDLIVSHYELSPYRNLDESTTVFSRYSLDTGEETPLLSSPVAGSSVSSYFSEGNLYWISSNQLDTLFWVDVNGNQNQMSLDWSGGTPAFDPNSYYNFKFITLIQNHLIFDMDSDHHCAYAIDLENGQTSLLPLTYLDALSGQEKPVNILQVVGSDLLVEFASVNQQSTHYNPDGTAFLLDVPLTRTGFISIDDYLSGQNNYREFSMLVSAS